MIKLGVKFFVYYYEAGLEWRSDEALGMLHVGWRSFHSPDTRLVGVALVVVVVVVNGTLPVAS